MFVTARHLEFYKLYASSIIVQLILEERRDENIDNSVNGVSGAKNTAWKQKETTSFV